MKKNVGGYDKFIRYFLAAMAFGIGYHYGSWWGLVGIVPLLTGYFNFCPLYRIFGWSTCRRRIKVE